MCYYLGTRTIGLKQWIQIDKEKYCHIRQHKAALICALEIEELFDVLLANYIEFEEEILRTSLKNSIMPSQKVNNLHAQRRELNRRISNLLSSARYYIDSLTNNYKTIFGESSTQYNELKDEVSRHYGTIFSYRLMWELRNYVQHKGMAADSLSSNYQLTKIQRDALVACTVTPLLVLQNYLSDKKIKSKMREEILSLSLPDTIDLKPHIREYITSLSAIHGYARTNIDREYQGWEKTIYDAIEQYSKHYALDDIKGVIGLAIFQCAGDNSNSFSEKHDIFTDFIEYRKHLYDTNKALGDLTKIYVTGQAKDTLVTTD